MSTTTYLESAVSSDVPELEFETVTYPNGLRLILHIDRKLPVVHVNQWFHVGSKNEKRGRTGFAHLFEHMMFQGSRNADADYFQYVERAGANLREGGVNGTTDFDRTNYFATVPSGNLEFLLWLESDRLATLAEALTQEKLDTQREVVRNERRQSYENQPYGRAYLLLNENLHPEGHPYSWDVIGSHEDLVAATLDDVKEFFETFYTPNNLSLTIAGDFDREEAKRLVERYFGSIPAGPALERARKWVPRLDTQKAIEVRDRVPQDRLYLCWPAGAYFDKGDAELDLLARILSDGLSSRLNRALVYDNQLCSDASAFNESRELSGLFAVVATARPGVQLGQVESIVDRELQRIVREGPTEEELNRARTKWEYDFISGLERIGGFGGKADRLNQYNTFLGDPSALAADLQRFRSATVESVRAAAEACLREQRLSLRFLVEQSSRAVAVTTDRSAAPELGVDPPFHAPQVEHRKLDNGMEIFVASRHDLPKVAVTLATRAGSVADPQGKEGVAHMMISTIDLGTATRDALQIENQLGDIGSSLSGAATREYSLLGFDVLERHLDAAFEVFADVVRQPRFPEHEVSRELNRQLDHLAQQSNNSGAIAARLRSMLAFGREHPYGRPTQGLPDSVRRIDRSDLAAFHQHYWKASTSALIFAGAITADEAVAVASRYFGDWSGDAAPAVLVPDSPVQHEAKVYLVDKQDAPQTVILQALRALPRTSDDFHVLRLVDAVWGGGGFGTRLNLNIREDKGYSYGVFSNLGALREATLWWAQGSVQTDKTAESLVEFQNELLDLAGRKPITSEELEAARVSRIRGYSQQFESLSRIAAQIAELWVLGLPLSELQREYDVTQQAPLERVHAVAHSVASPDDAFLLLVGDLSKIEEPVRALGLGPVVVLDVEGRRVR